MMWRQIVVCFVAAFCLAVFCNTNNAEAATDWPGFQERLKAGQSSSVNAASIPEDTAITPPDSSLSVKLTSYSGKWHGWMCRYAVTSIEVAIKAISAENATIGYAVATNERSSRYQEFEAKVDDGELIGNLRSGSAIIIGQREDGNLNIKWISGRNARRWCTGILARAGSSALKHKYAVPGKSIMLETELQEDGKPIRLEYVVYKPAGDGPFPVLVFNHGSTGSGRNTDIFTLCGQKTHTALLSLVCMDTTVLYDDEGK